MQISKRDSLRKENISSAKKKDGDDIQIQSITRQHPFRGSTKSQKTYDHNQIYLVTNDMEQTQLKLRIEMILNSIKQREASVCLLQHKRTFLCTIPEEAALEKSKEI